jgi:1-acyl-sn-glycerol-3-phosphate acyltransferase
MPKYIVLSRLNAQGWRVVRERPDRFAEVRRELAALDVKVLHECALFGPYDFLAVVEAPDNLGAFRLEIERQQTGRSRVEILPAIDLDLFIRLLGQTTETVGPYPWQISPWARIVRRLMRYYTITRYVRRYCRPFTVEGGEHLEGLRGPVIFIGNHSSHMDSFVLFMALPRRFRSRVAFGAAADRWFIKGRKGIEKQPWYLSLTMNSFPIQRGGGKSALRYAEWLIEEGWSLVIFPEGTRSTTGKLAHFRHGVSILALSKDVPVVPIYMEGLREMRPKGTQQTKPGPAVAKIGEPIRFPKGTSVADATRTLYRKLEGMREAAHGSAPVRPTLEHAVAT